MAYTRTQMVDLALKYNGAKYKSAKHKDLVDTFNRIHPHGQTGNYTCPWCCITITALLIKGGYTNKTMPMGYNCGNFVNDAKKLGIWEEKDNYKPKKGDFVIYYWKAPKGACKSGASHIGIVIDDTKNNKFKVLEGNMGKTEKVSYVGTRTVTVGWRYIRGFVKPNYDDTGFEKYSGKLPDISIAYDVKTTDRAADLAKAAYSISHSYNTPEKKWKYATGAPTAECKEAMNKINYKTKVSYSDCGYFITTIVHVATGKKLKFLKGTKDPFPAVAGFDLVHKGAIGNFQLEPGDIIRYKKNNGHQHIVMYVGDGLISEAGRSTRFGVIRKSTKYNGSAVKKSSVEVLRIHEDTIESKTRNYLCMGDKGEAVQNVQNFLVWAGFLTNKNLTSTWGERTEKAANDFGIKIGVVDPRDTTPFQWGNGMNQRALNYQKEVH